MRLPGAGTVDAYLEWAKQARAQGRPILFQLYLAEAREIATLLGRVRTAEIKALEQPAP
jgi:hypothetical protein